jgi:hypothetical protein
MTTPPTPPRSQRVNSNNPLRLSISLLQQQQQQQQASTNDTSATSTSIAHSLNVSTKLQKSSFVDSPSSSSNDANNNGNNPLGYCLPQHCLLFLVRCKFVLYLVFSMSTKLRVEKHTTSVALSTCFHFSRIIIVRRFFVSILLQQREEHHVCRGTDTPSLQLVVYVNRLIIPL